MPRALLVINGPVDRRRAARWVEQAPAGTRIEFKSSKRSLPQNARLHAMITDLATQLPWHGLKLTVDDWKLIFLDALKREVRMVPNIDGTGFVNLGRSTSDLSKDEMSDMMELISAFGAKHNVTFHDPETATEDKPPASDAAGRAGFPHAAGAADLEESI